jgi:hypothetical protein
MFALKLTLTLLLYDRYRVKTVLTDVIPKYSQVEKAGEGVVVAAAAFFAQSA